MQCSDPKDDSTDLKTENMGKDSEAQSEQPSDFSTEIMSVTEMEQSPDNSPSAQPQEEEEAQDCEAPGAEEDKTEDSEDSFPLEFDKFWNVVETNPQDFTGWVYLLQYVEQENHLLAARKAFDRFFVHYPYCYGYWKKYADMEKRHGNMKQSDEVYRRGLQAIPLSIDLWIHYINFLKETLDASDPEAVGTIRGTYEHAVLAAGTDFRSDKLWEMYINWENDEGSLKAVTAVFDRILGIPTQLYSHHFQRFKEHVQNNLPRDILSTEQFVQLRRELASAHSHNGEEAPPGDDFPSGTEEITDPAKLITEIENMRHRIIEIHQEMFNHNEHEVSKRWTFEEGVTAPYLHVKPSREDQTEVLNGFKTQEFYFIIVLSSILAARSEVGSIQSLLCLQMQYAKYMENHSIEGVRHVYSRACTIHLTKKPMVHLLWAAFEEQQGNIHEARRILKTFEENVSGLAMIRLRRVSLERRHGNLEEAEHLLQEAVRNSKSNYEASFFAVKLARHLFKVQKSLPKARKVLLEAIDRDRVGLKASCNLKQDQHNEKQARNDVSPSSPPQSLFICRLLDAYEEHQSLLKEQETLKRKAENGCEEGDEKRPHGDEAALAAGQVADGDMQASQAAYNYSAWYQYNYPNAWNYGQYYQASST
uniref:Pre-mRNA processing factor 39 n=1 Tax=Anolis carolinensis TaxID=28377 RepID=H9G8F5_ANOCA